MVAAIDQSAVTMTIQEARVASIVEKRDIFLESARKPEKEMVRAKGALTAEKVAILLENVQRKKATRVRFLGFLMIAKCFDNQFLTLLLLLIQGFRSSNGSSFNDQSSTSRDVGEDRGTTNSGSSENWGTCDWGSESTSNNKPNSSPTDWSDTAGDSKKDSGTGKSSSDWGNASGNFFVLLFVFFTNWHWQIRGCTAFCASSLSGI